MKIKPKLKLINALKFLFLFPLVLVSGCASIKGELPSDYQINSHPGEGIAIFTVSCDVDKGQTYMIIGEASHRMNIFAKNYTIFFNCNSPKENMSEPELKIVNLPAGNYYAIWYFMSTNYNSVYFTVNENKLNYLGRLNLKYDPDKNYPGASLSRTETKIAFGEDMPKIKQKLSFLKPRDIEVNPFQPPPAEYR